VTDEISYKVGVMTVEMTIEHGIPMDFSCECEEWTKNQSNPMLQTLNQKKCRHIREAEMYHHFADRVSPAQD
jgi:hypothetical protein